MENAIIIRNLRKVFGRTVALKDVSLTIPTGSIFLLMGPNGSGKSTLLKIVTGLIKPTYGKVEILGMDPWKQRHKIFAKIGAMFEDYAPPDWAQGKDYLEYKAKLKKAMDPEDEASRVAKLFGVDSFWNHPFSAYSSGMKRKLALADAFINDPELVILDDPTVALDREARLTLQQIIANRATQDKTYLIASHIITEFESHVSHLAVLSLGQTVVTGKIKDVAEKMEIQQVTIRTNQVENAVKILVEKKYAIRVYDNHITIDRIENPEEIISILGQSGIKAEREETKVNLWEVYARALTFR